MFPHNLNTLQLQQTRNLNKKDPTEEYQISFISVNCATVILTMETSDKSSLVNHQQNTFLFMLNMILTVAFKAWTEKIW